jgi:hypothetical protein
VSGGAKPSKVSQLQTFLNLKMLRVTQLGSQFILVIYLFSFSQITTEFIRQDNGWDIDHEIYFGQELLRGNLLWTVEFHDKLPILQYLFAIAATFQNPVIVWKLISLSSALLAIMCVARLLPEVLKRIGYSEKRAKGAAILSGGIYLSVSSVVPGRFNHINVISASMAIIASLVGFALLRCKIKLHQVFGIASFAGLAAAIAISIRPYFIFPLLIGFLMIGFLIMQEKSLGTRQKISRITCLFSMPCVIGVFLNFGPYLLFGKSEEFFSGLSFLLQPAQPVGSIIDFFVEPGFGLGWFLRFWLGGMLLFSLIDIGISSRRKNERLEAAFMSLSVLSLLVGISTQHFWSHYINLFSWYFAILLGMKLVYFDKFISRLRQRKLWQLFLSATANFLGLTFLVLSVVSLGIDKPSRQHPSEALALAMESKFSRDPYSRPIFLVPEDMYVHWKLKEPRHGFPHASNTFHIFQGLWENTGGSHAFRHPITKKEYCAEILQSPIELIVLREDSDLQSCFFERKSQFRFEQILKSDSGNWNLWTKR